MNSAPDVRDERAISRTMTQRATWAVALVAAAVFANSLANGFAYDDRVIIQENTAIHELETLPAALAKPYWPGDLGAAFELWRPLSTGIYGLEWSLWGDSPAPFHALNVLLHCAAAVLVFRLLLLFVPFWGAVAGALVFAVHSVHVEAVANVVGRAEVLSAVLYLSACLLFCRWRTALDARRVAALCALYAAGFLTKESAVTLPGVLFLLDGFFEDTPVQRLGAYLRARWHLYAGLAATGGLVLLGRELVLGDVAGPLPPFGTDILQEIPRIWTVAATWPQYFRLLLFPADLSIDYTPAVVHIYHGWSVAGILGVTLVLGSLVAALWSWKAPALREGGPPPRAAGLGIAWFAVTISPTANVLFLSGVLLAERTLYLPSVGLAFVVGWIVSSVHVERPRVAAILVASVVLLLSVRTVTRNPVWKNTAAAFESLARDHPESARIQWARGDILLNQGKVSEALHAYRVAVGTAGGHYSLITGIGQNLIDLGRFRSATALLEAAWQDEPRLMLAPTLLLNTYAQLEDWPDAERVARGVLDQKPDNASMHHLLALSLRNQGRWGEATVARRATIAAGEGDHWQQWYWLAEEEARAGDPVDAAAALDSARIRIGEGQGLRQVDSLEVELGLQ